MNCDTCNKSILEPIAKSKYGNFCSIECFSNSSAWKAEEERRLQAYVNSQVLLQDKYRYYGEPK